MQAEIKQYREECLNDLFTYAQVMFPKRYFGDLHRDLFSFFQKSLEGAMETGEGHNAGALVPRDHQKSFCIAVTVSWAITKYPWFTVAYVSSNPTLSERQLTVIKNIFHSDYHRELFPEMLNYEFNARTKEIEHRPLSAYTKTEFSVDHPDRPKSEKDPTISATSAKSTNTGSHFKVCVFDDLVTNENYRSSAEREDIREVYQSFASIATTGSIMWLVGTRYGDNDLYASLKEKSYDVIDDDTGETLETKPLWSWFERVVEDSTRKDGTGTYVWPRTRMPDGSWYGFNATELSKKRSNAFNLDLFYAQYYNDPNAVATDKIDSSCFQYINPSSLRNDNGKWFYGPKELKLNCGMDLAFSEGSGIKKVRRDFTAIAVTAWDADGYLYVLDLKRFQTKKAEVYYKELIELYHYWGFREATIETNAGGAVIHQFVQDEIRRDGLALVVKGQTKTAGHGKKEERNAQILEPLYRNQSVYHVQGGYTKLLEEELRLNKPPHDDLTDALYIAVSSAKRLSKTNKGSGLRRRGNVVQGRFRQGRRRA